jgi:UDP-N-acetylmuramyl tripeptide synthase
VRDVSTRTVGIPLDADRMHRARPAGLTHKQVFRVGRLVKLAAQLRGGGTALPGLVVERIDPHFLTDLLAGLPEGVILVTGTNGKTTTTKMIVELLRTSGLSVVTNKTGSNFSRGIIAGLLDDLDPDGRLTADVAVLELDEAHAIPFVQRIAPRYSVLLNVSRDQLDRFGEVDATAELLEKVARATTAGVVLNRNDPLIKRVAAGLRSGTEVRYFGFNESFEASFPRNHGSVEMDDFRRADDASPGLADVTLVSLERNQASFAYGDHVQPATALTIDGVHNALNGAAALCLVRMVLGERADSDLLRDALGAVRPAFGRGESIDVGGHPLELVLVKNPTSFQMAVDTYAGREATEMIAINDNYADGTDPSWLWDVDFEALSDIALVSGSRAFDMAIRLQYEDVDVARVEPSLPKALSVLLREGGPKRIYCTYTAMITLRRILEKTHRLERIE